LYTQQWSQDRELSLTGAWARKDRSDGVSLDAWLGEAAYSPSRWLTFFGRAEAIETDELGAIHHGPVEDVAKLSVGVVHDGRLGLSDAFVSLGALVRHNWVSDALSPLYGGDPWGGLVFVRLKIS